MKFLVIIRRYLGDVLLASPLVGELKKRFPYSRVDLLVNASTLPAAEMVRGVDRILPYKIYPPAQRNRLLNLLKKLDLPIVATGGSSPLDSRISSDLPKEKWVHDLAGLTSLDEFGALCRMARCYIGMDTFNTHLAAALNTRVFAIYGPTLLSRWSPWSNDLQRGAKGRDPVQTYGQITIFQAGMDCVPCGKVGCDDQGGASICLERIDPESVFEEVRQWLSR